MTRKVERIDDALADPLYEKKEDAKVEGTRSMIGVPLMRDGDPVVVIGLGRRRFDPFGEREIELAATFATQAVVAIENARLLDQLRRRTTDLGEALDRQTAASDVLQVISSYSGDLEPVFATMLEKAVRICDATFGNIYRCEGDALHLVATHKTPPAFAEERRRSPYHPHPASPVGHMVSTKTPMHGAVGICRANFGNMFFYEDGAFRAVAMFNKGFQRKPNRSITPLFKGTADAPCNSAGLRQAGGSAVAWFADSRVQISSKSAQN